MPGIVGLITSMPRERAESEMMRMVRAIQHESFYAIGTWIDEGLGLYVGWTVREQSFSDGMPLSNEQGDTVLIFSGEDYAEPGTRSHLRKQGHSLKEEDGPSYLVHLAEEDPAFPAGLNGTFHGLLVNRSRRTAKLFNDRYGMHRIYYHKSKEAFYFAAEAKTILTVRPELRSPDMQSLGELASCGCVLENRTLFQGIHVLPPASAWTLQNYTIAEQGTYFRPQEWEEQPPLAPDTYYQELRDRFASSLPRYFEGQERIGISLTGGLDTRVIMAWRKPQPASLPCYTFGGALRDCQDVQVARRVAKVCQQSHEVITVGNEFLSQFARYAERSIYLSEGGVDVSRSSDLYVSEKARHIAPVKIVGTYGSEIIRHAVMFKPVMPMPGLFRPEFLSHITRAGDTYAQVRREHPVTFAAFRQSPWHHYGVLALEQTQLGVRSPYLDNDFVRTVYRSPRSNGAGDDIRLRLICDGNPVLSQIRSDLGIGGDSGRIATMSSRFLLKLTFKAEYAYDYGMPPWISSIDHFFSPLRLERLFLGRHKLLHFRVWYRDELSKYVRGMLLDPVTLSRPYIERKGVEAIVNGHLKEGRNYTTEIHKLLTLELMHRLFLDPQ